MGSLMPLKCIICGTDMMVSFTACGNQQDGFCSRECYKEYNWRRALSITDNEYRQDPTVVKDGHVRTPEGYINNCSLAAVIQGFQSTADASKHMCRICNGSFLTDCPDSKRLQPQIEKIAGEITRAVSGRLL